jgi:hypothetical protein
MRRLSHNLGVIATLLALSLLASSGPGLYGHVVISPSRPVCVVGKPCTAPDKNDVLAFWRSGRRVASARTDASGDYRTRLAAGRYRVTAPRHAAVGRGLKPSEVVVPTGRFARVNFALDIGIR